MRIHLISLHLSVSIFLLMGLLFILPVAADEFHNENLIYDDHWEFRDSSVHDWSTLWMI